METENGKRANGTICRKVMACRSFIILSLTYLSLTQS